MTQAPRAVRDGAHSAATGMVIIAAALTIAFGCGGAAVGAIWWASEVIG